MKPAAPVTTYLIGLAASSASDAYLERPPGRGAVAARAVRGLRRSRYRALWWEPLHLDEAITIDYATRSYASDRDRVFLDRRRRAAALLHRARDARGLRRDRGLRLPSVGVLPLSLVLAALLARELAGEEAALLTPVLLAVAPLGVSLATFARMYSLFVAAVLGATLLAALSPAGAESEATGSWPGWSSAR